MNLIEAVEQLKSGKAIRRSSWGGCGDSGGTAGKRTVSNLCFWESHAGNAGFAFRRL